MIPDARIATVNPVKARRLELKLRAEDVASRSGLSVSTVFRAERGDDTSLGTLRALAKALDTTVAALVDNGEAA